MRLQRFIRCAFMMVVCAIVMAGCASPAPTVFTSPLASPIGTSTAVFHPSAASDGRRLSALEAYPIAEKRAKVWNPNAKLYAVVPSWQMLRNLGAPAQTPGWFYKFGTTSDTIELYVQVISDQIAGVKEMQPILPTPLPYEMLPIDVSKVKLSNADALKAFLQQDKQDYFKTHTTEKLDYWLVYLKGTPNPVWVLVDDAAPTYTVLIGLDAVTGQVVGDPFAPYRK